MIERILLIACIFMFLLLITCNYYVTRYHTNEKYMPIDKKTSSDFATYLFHENHL